MTIEMFHVVLSPLFDPQEGTPLPLPKSNVNRAPGIANCPVAAMLAALASTTDGQKKSSRASSPLRRFKGDVVTDSVGGGSPEQSPRLAICSGPPDTSPLSYKAVQFEVSDVLYTDDHDSGLVPVLYAGIQAIRLFGRPSSKRLSP